MKRPISVSVISWLAIIFGCITLFPAIYMLYSPQVLEATREILAELRPKMIPVDVKVALGFITPPIWFVCGIFMLRGKNWARMLFLIGGFLGVSSKLLAYEFSILALPSCLFYLLFFYFLTRPKANQYFRQENGSASQRHSAA